MTSFFNILNKISKSVLALVIAAPMFTTSVVAQEKSISGSDDKRTFNAEERLAIDEMIRTYILNNPEIISDALETLQVRRQTAELQAQQDAISNSRKKLLFSEHQVVLGNPDGDITLVEFFDYNCGFCRRALIDMERLIAEDDNLRVVLKEFPVLGQGSFEAAQIAVAANTADPSKYLDFHRLLLSSRGQVDKNVALRAAEQVGYDASLFENIEAKPEVRAALEEVYLLADQLNLNGTPTYVLGNEVFPGAVGFDILKERIAALRGDGETSTQ